MQFLEKNVVALSINIQFVKNMAYPDFLQILKRYFFDEVKTTQKNYHFLGLW
jgi:hypothetical protein